MTKKLSMTKTVKERTQEKETNPTTLEWLEDIVTILLEEPYDLERMLSNVLNKLHEAHNLSGGCIFLLDRGKKEFKPKVFKNIPKDFVEALSRTKLSNRTKQAGQSDKGRHKFADINSALTKSLGCSVLTVPLVASDETLGMMSLAKNSDGFGHGEMKFFNAISRQIGVAIKNAEYMSSLLKRVGKLSSLLSISATIELNLKLEQLLDLIAQQAAVLLESDLCYFTLATEDGEALEVKSCFGRSNAKGTRVEIGKTPSGMVFLQGIPLMLNDAASLAHYNKTEVDYPTSSVLIVPMLTMDRSLGTLVVGNKSGESTQFTPDDQELLGALANQVSMILENFMLFEKISRGKAEWENLFDSITDLICVHDTEFQIIRVNKAFAHRLNAAPKDLLEKKCYDVIYGEKPDIKNEKSESRTQSCPYVQTAECHRTFEEEVTLPSLDGIFMLSSFPLLDARYQPYAFVHVLKDITLQKKLEQQLLQAQKMESIGTLAGGVAHDFNNVLAAIIPNAEMIKIKLPLNDPNYKRADTIEKAAKRAAALTNQLLSFSRKWKLNVTVINPNQSIEATIGFLENLINKNILVETKLQPGVWNIQAGESQIEQVIMNLALNACDAMPNGGKLTLKTENLTLDDEFCRTKLDLKPGRYVCISVCDTGVGMEKDVLERAFEPFFTTKKLGKGTGLGLSVVYGIVKNYGGHIEAQSEVNVGTAFTVYFPASDKATAKQEIRPEAELVCGQGKVLVIDDEEFVRDVLKEILEKLGYEVFAVANGQEAIEIYNASHQEIKLVILDMTMPKMGGEKVYSRLKQINPNVRVLLSSGYSQEGKIQEVIRDGISGFIQKPYTVEEIGRAVQEAIKN